MHASSFARLALSQRLYFFQRFGLFRVLAVLLLSSFWRKEAR